MANPSVSFTKPTQTNNNWTENQTSENISAENSPEYDALYPKPQKYIRIPVKVDQPQLEARCNIGSTSTVMNSRSRNDITTYKSWSIFNIICCCLPLGCFACYYSSRIEDLLRMGNFDDASKASKKALTINIIATYIGILMIPIIIFVHAQQIHQLQQNSRQTSRYGI